MSDLEDIIRRGQDRLRGRPRNWRDDLGDWWQHFTFYDNVFVPVYGFLVTVYFCGAIGTGIWLFVRAMTK